jgi:beta-mannosidase
MKQFFLINLILFFSIFIYGANGFHQSELSSGWKIKKLNPTPEISQTDKAIIDLADGWIQVREMPAMVHDVLMQNGLMEAHYLPGVAKKFLWVAEADWIYAKDFNANDLNEIAFLKFEGLDCLVDIYLNGERIGSNSNALFPCRFDITGKLRRNNKLWIHFHSVFEKKDGKSVPIKIFRGSEVRRSAHDYDTYLGPNPYFSRVGVYGKVFLETTLGIEMHSVMAGTQLNENLKEGTITVDVDGVSKLPTVTVSVTVFDQNNVKSVETKENIEVQSGSFEKKIKLSIANPKLWWPRGYGNPNLYTAVIKLLAKGKEHQAITKTLGFRRVTQTQLLHFEINNVPIKLWGGDWVSPKMVTAVWDNARAEQLIRMAEIANFNAFRVWSESKSPDDKFYEMCDSHGFMIWQDFNNLPFNADEKSISICKNEATLFVKRLKSHPSILVWNGGNENALWYHKDYNGPLEDRGEWPGIVAANEVGKVLQNLDPDRYYQPTSPWLGIDPNDPQKGSTHGYTNLWYVPGYDYPNFVPEDTRIAAPVLQSCEKFMAKEDIWPSDYSPIYTHGVKLPFPKTWMKYTTTESWKKTGPVEQFYDADNAEQLIYRLGMAESLYYQKTIEMQRRGRPATDPTDARRCGGYLVWKFNDSWPQIYSAKVDYFLEPYHSYYAIKRAFQPVMLSFEAGAYIWLWAVNDSRDTIKGKVNIELFHLDQNKVRETIEREVIVKPGKSMVVVRLDQAGIGSFRREHILHATLNDVLGKRIAEAFSPGDIERRTTFPDAKVEISIRDGKLVLKSDKYAHTVTLEGNDHGDQSGFLFSDNYFELMPSEEKIIEILGNKLAGKISVKAWYSTRNSTIEWERQDVFINKPKK